MATAPSYTPNARTRCVCCGHLASTSPSVPVMLTTTTKGKPRYAHVACLHAEPRAMFELPAGNGPVYNDLTYRVHLLVKPEHDSDALAVALLNEKQKNQWTRVWGGYAIRLNNLKSHRIFETIADRCPAGTLSCEVYHGGSIVDVVTIDWANRNAAGRWLRKSERADARRCDFLMEVDAVTVPKKGYTNYPDAE